jgi:hypothetical protein
MQLLSLSKTLNMVETTAVLLNGPLPPGYVVAEIFSLDRHDPLLEEAFREFLQKLVEEWMRCGNKVIAKDAVICASEMRLDEAIRRLPSVAAVEDVTRNLGNSWLWGVYWDYLHRAKPNIWFDSDGEVTFDYTRPICGKLELPVALPPFLPEGSPNLYCWMDAMLWFVLLLNSGYAQRLDRCAFCKRYFVRQRGVKSGQVYKRGGANCGNCRGEVAKARTSDARTVAKDRMLRDAAAAWTDWKKSNRTPDRYAAVADRVNAKCKKDIYITTRRSRIEPLWVKRNEKAILARAERNAENKGEN